MQFRGVVFVCAVCLLACDDESGDREMGDGMLASDVGAPGDGPSAGDSAVMVSDAQGVLDARLLVDAVAVDAETGTNPCVFPLVKLQTGPSDTCAGGNEHHWPIGMAPEACHGWSATDPMGREHNNSANEIGCTADGSFQFTQFAGNLDCSGSGVTKTYRLDVCQQDIPPRLHTIAFDLSCCLAPESASCARGVPRITVPGGRVFLNRAECETAR